MIGLTPAIADAIVTAVENGQPIRGAARMAGIAESTLREWAIIGTGFYSNGVKASEEATATSAQFAQRIALARAKFEATVVENMRQAGFRELKGGGTDWRAHLELLKHHPEYRKDWREFRELRIQQSGTISHEHRQVRELTDDQLLLEAPADLAILIEGPRAESDQEVISGPQ